MNILGTSASVIIPGNDIIPPFIEYFLIIYLKDGSRTSYPIGAPDSAAPYRIDIIPVSDKDKEVIILSPEKDELINLSDLLISISLLRATDLVDKTATKIYINENDVSSMALFADDLILFYPENFSGIVSGGRFLLRV